MKASLPTLRTSYRSGTYTMDLFRNRDPAYQHMVALIERAPPNTVTDCRADDHRHLAGRLHRDRQLHLCGQQQRR
ncbi:hypothetical protein [Comamonas sp. JC664]|uniref:hypothetical protein n=1 Tax=Comamonas sp. JC664 TaxID=2801917 RepID=UPI00366B2D1C